MPHDTNIATLPIHGNVATLNNPLTSRSWHCCCCGNVAKIATLPRVEIVAMLAMLVSAERIG